MGGLKPCLFCLFRGRGKLGKPAYVILARSLSSSSIYSNPLVLFVKKSAYKFEVEFLKLYLICSAIIPREAMIRLEMFFLLPCHVCNSEHFWAKLCAHIAYLIIICMHLNIISNTWPQISQNLKNRMFSANAFHPVFFPLRLGDYTFQKVGISNWIIFYLMDDLHLKLRTK